MFQEDALFLTYWSIKLVWHVATGSVVMKYHSYFAEQWLDVQLCM